MPLSFYELAIQTLIIYLLKTILFVFLMRTIFKVFIEFVTIMFLFYVLVSREVSSWTKDWTCNPCTGRQCLNNWTDREASGHLSIELYFYLVVYCWGRNKGRVQVKPCPGNCLGFFHYFFSSELTWQFLHCLVWHSCVQPWLFLFFLFKFKVSRFKQIIYLASLCGMQDLSSSTRDPTTSR